MVQTDAQIRVGDKSFRVADYLLDMGWIEYPFSSEDVCFLAAGEYNENYIVNVGPGYVLRINHGSQLGLEDQIGYEFNVLQSVVSSGVTPRPYRVDSQTKVMGRGTLLMQYLPGGAFQYGRDTIKAADVFARLHSLPVSSDLLVQAAPVHAIAAESLELLQRYRTPALHSEQKRLLKYHDHILNLAETSGDLFVNDPLVIVNTEVNSGNFIVDGDAVWLVDWEKAVVSSRYQDLGHFLVETTTRWKTDYVFTAQEKREFVAAYLRAGGWDIDLDEALYKTSLLEKTILLRALSWCYMAYHEYTRPGRALTNSDTFGQIQNYLDEMECILA